MNQNQPKKYDLDWEKTFHYFFKQLFLGNSLSAEVLKMVDLKDGKFFTLLPENANLDLLYNFKISGIIPQMDPVVEPGKGSWIKVQDMSHELSDWIYDFLQSTPSYGIGEDVLRDITDRDPDLPIAPKLYLEKERYYLLRKETPLNVIWQTVGDCDAYYHMLIVLIEGTTNLQEELTEEVLRKIASKAKFLIGTAYDSQSYIIWERETNDYKNRYS